MALDDDITKAVEYALTIADSLSGQNIGIDVRSGVIVLSGTVETDAGKAAAQTIARSFDDVRAVKNEIHVIHSDTRKDEEVAEQIRIALDAQTEIRRESINVSVKSGMATLTGRARSFWERTLVEDTAMSAGGVRRVQNHLDTEPVDTNDSQCNQRGLTEK